MLLTNDRLDDAELALEQSVEQMNAAPALGKSPSLLIRSILMLEDGAGLVIFTVLPLRVRSSMDLAATQMFVQVALIQRM